MSERPVVLPTRLPQLPARMPQIRTRGGHPVTHHEAPVLLDQIETPVRHLRDRIGRHTRLDRHRDELAHIVHPLRLHTSDLRFGELHEPATIDRTQIGDRGHRHVTAQQVPPQAHQPAGPRCSEVETHPGKDQAGRMAGRNPPRGRRLGGHLGKVKSPVVDDLAPSPHPGGQIVDQPPLLGGHDQLIDRKRPEHVHANHSVAAERRGNRPHQPLRNEDSNERSGPMSRSVRLRRWQHDALEAFDNSPEPNFLAVATPGAGKTTFAVAAVIRHLVANPSRRAVIVVPTTHLKVQWARAAAHYGLHLEPNWKSSTRTIPTDMHGIVVTYAQVATSAGTLSRFAHRCIVVLDEIHHAGDDQTWGTAVRAAFEAAPRRLTLSGTPFRSDTHAIPFVTYRNDEAVADYTYGYSDALADRRVVRPVYFPSFGGEMEWVTADGAAVAASFDDELDDTLAAQRLRTALTPGGDWFATVAADAHQRLSDLRVDQPDAAGLVIATDRDHAHTIARTLRTNHQVPVEVVTSDDPTASDRIARFADSTAPWIVAVRMVSEGVDIPRLRVGVYATTTTTELFFRQVVGRFVRHTGGTATNETAWLYLPNDLRLRTHAAAIAAERRHTLRASWEDGDPRHRPERDPAELDPTTIGDDDQMSLFEALSAQVTGPANELPVDGVDVDGPDDIDTAVSIDLPAPPPLGGSSQSMTARSLADEKRQLRALNTELTKKICALTGHQPRTVNSHLNGLVGLRRVADANITQLDRRARHAQRWLATT